MTEYRGECMSPSQYNRMLNSAYIKLCIIELCQQMGMQTAQPVVSNAALALGATVTVAGILAGLSSAISLSLRIASGHIISRTAPKKVLVVSSAILAVSALLFVLLNSVPALAVSRVLYGTGIVVKTVIVVSVCVRVVPKDSIGQAVAWLGMANVLAVAIGPNLAQFIGLSVGYNTTFLLSGTFFAVATILCVTFPNVPLSEEEGEGPAGLDESEAPVDSLAEPAPVSPQPPAKGIARLWNYIYYDSLPLALLGFLEGTIFGIVNTLTLTASQLRGLPETSLFFVVYVIVSFCERPIVGKLYDRYGFSKVCPAMCFIMGLSMLTFAFTDSVAMVVVDGVLFALGQGSLWPCLQAESVHGIPQEKSGLSTNTLLFGVDLGIMAGPMLGGAILDIAGPMWMYLFATGVGVLLTLWTLQYVRIMRRRAAVREAQQKSETQQKT